MNKYNVVIPEPPTESSTTNRAFYRRKLREKRKLDQQAWQRRGFKRADARFLATLPLT